MEGMGDEYAMGVGSDDDTQGAEFIDATPPNKKFRPLFDEELTTATSMPGVDNEATLIGGEPNYGQEVTEEQGYTLNGW